MAKNNISAYDIYYNSITNDTSAFNDTSVHEPQTFLELVGDTAFDIIVWILLVLSLAAAIYGVTSWCIIKKFRHFRNYVLLSVIIANVLRVTVLQFYTNIITYELLTTYPILHYCFLGVFLYFSLAFQCWLLVLCYVFSVDFVKVFHLNIRRRSLMSSLFAWGVSLIIVLLYFLASWLLYLYDLRDIVTYEAQVSILLVPSMISFVIYIAVLDSLFRCTKTDISSSINKWRRFYIATLFFVLSNVIVLTAIPQLMDIKILIIDVIGELGEYLNIIALDVYIVVVKSNWKLWREFLSKRSKQNSSVTDYETTQTAYEIS